MHDNIAHVDQLFQYCFIGGTLVWLQILAYINVHKLCVICLRFEELYAFGKRVFKLVITETILKTGIAVCTKVAVVYHHLPRKGG